LTGGFLVAVLNGEDVTACKDIDFFISSSITENFFAMALEHFFDANRPDYYVEPPYRDLKPNIARVITNYINGKQIQFIYGKAGIDNQIQHYVRTFDLDVCKSYFTTGNVLRSTPRAFVEMLTHTCEVDIIATYHRPRFAVAYRLDTIYSRLKKYMERGYQIHCSFRINSERIDPSWVQFWMTRIECVTGYLK
jgi:hypothetical protein